MLAMTAALPQSFVDPVTEILHGVAVTDPYRWLEDGESPRTREWIREQMQFARGYLDRLPGRERIAKRIREFLAIETFDSLQEVGGRYFFRKRLPREEQPGIYMRKGADGEDELLVDPFRLGEGPHTAVKLVRVSPDGNLLLYEIKEGGERTGRFALYDVAARQTLPEILPRGYLRGFAFAPDAKGFYYVHEALNAERPFYRAAYQHRLGSDFAEDIEIFRAGENPNLRLSLLADSNRIGYLVCRFGERVWTDFYLSSLGWGGNIERIVAGADYMFTPVLACGRIFAVTDLGAPNLRIVELHLRENARPLWTERVPESDARIQQWIVARHRIFVSYLHDEDFDLRAFDFTGRKIGKLPERPGETIRLAGVSSDRDELFIETESFTRPISIFRQPVSGGHPALWARRSTPLDTSDWNCARVWYPSRDRTQIPMYLVGRGDILASESRPTVMTSYGGFGVSMTPQFSVFVAFLVEHGCLFALPGIRGGSEFGETWHAAAKRRNRQTAYDDFLAAAKWLIETKRTTPEKLAIFGGSNSGLLVAVALTQRPDLFRAAVLIAPMVDMLRYHRFDSAHVWRGEFGTAEDPGDFAVLRGYSPYHRIENGTAYPATLIVSGDADRNCNPLHARKMTARLQAASASGRPILLDYSPFRGHSPVLPLSQRIEALTDRMAFLCDQLELKV